MDAWKDEERMNTQEQEEELRKPALTILMCFHDRQVAVVKLTTAVQTSRILMFLTRVVCAQCIENQQRRCIE